MAPIQSKQAAPKDLTGPAAFVDLVTAAVWEQFDRTLEDLADLAVFVADCCDAVGEEIGMVGQSAAEALGDAFLSAMNSLRCCNGASCWSGGKSVPLMSTAPVIFIMQVVGILYSSFVFCYMPAAGIAMDSPISLLFHALVFMILASYTQVYFTDPGRPPDTEEWQDFDNPPSCLRERKVSGTGGARWCRKSNMYKPDRAHYCKASNSVVLRMDHHCPWLGNTIGYANHKYFFLVLLYTCATCSLVDINFLSMLLQATLPPSTLLVLLESAGISFLLSSILLPFFVFHCWLIANNMTTIEFCERRSKEKQKKQEQQEDGAASMGDPDVENMYDIGFFENCRSVLGTNLLTWFLPIGGPTGDGIRFPRSRNYEVEWGISARFASYFLRASGFSQPSPLPELGPAGLEFEPEVTGVIEAEDAKRCGDHIEAGPAEADAAAEEERQIPQASTATEEASAWPSLGDAACDILAGCNLLADVSQDAVSMIANIFSGSVPAAERPSASSRATPKRSHQRAQVKVAGKKRVHVHGLSVGSKHVGHEGFLGQQHFLDGAETSSTSSSVACAASPVLDDVSVFSEGGSVADLFLSEVETKVARHSVASTSTTASVSRLSQFSVVSAGTSRSSIINNFESA